MPKSARKIRNIAFFGDANVLQEDPVYKEAFKTAKLLGEAGYRIVDGGGPGVMVAATTGARMGGGKTLTVTFDPKDVPGFEGRYLKNVPDREIRTNNYIDRMFKLLENGVLFIIFTGGSGTISEFGTAWVLAKLYYGRHKPFILFGDFWADIIDVLRKNMNIDKNELAVFEIVRTKGEVLSTIKRLEKKIRRVK